MRLQDIRLQEAEQSNLLPFYISFGDLLVVLSTFFLMLLSMSQLEVGNFEKMKVGFTGKKEGTLVALAEKLEKIAAKKRGLSVSLGSDGVRVDMETVTLFDSGSAKLKPGSLDPLEPIFVEMKKTQYKIDIEGHTDDRGYYRKVGDDIDTNWSLSGRRSSSVVHYLIDFGFAESRLRIVGYASNRPKIPYDDKDGRALERARAENRRVSLLIH